MIPRPWFWPILAALVLIAAVLRTAWDSLHAGRTWEGE